MFNDRTKWWVSILVTAIISFGCGLIVYRYKIFPYDQVKWITHHIHENHPEYSHLAGNNHTKYYLFRKSFFEVNGVKADIVMIGDSITDEAEWNELFPDLRIVNRGIRGDTTAGVLNRMNSILTTQAKKAFIMLGHNDLKRQETVDDVYGNYLEILTILKSKGIIPYVQSTLLAGRRMQELNKKIKKLNLRLESLCGREGLVYIDLNKKLARDGILDRSFSMDDVHLNGKGYLAWRAQIKPYLK